MGKIKKILENELVGGTQSTDVYPVTSTKAVYDENNENLDSILDTKVNTSDIVQQTGDSTTSVMSQKAVSDKLDDLSKDYAFRPAFTDNAQLNKYIKEIYINRDAIKQIVGTSVVFSVYRSYLYREKYINGIVVADTYECWNLYDTKEEAEKNLTGIFGSEYICYCDLRALGEGNSVRKNAILTEAILSTANAPTIANFLSKRDINSINSALLAKIDKSSIVQQLGESEDKVMSQKSVSTKFNNLSKDYAFRPAFTDNVQLNKYIKEIYDINNILKNVTSEQEILVDVFRSFSFEGGFVNGFVINSRMIAYSKYDTQEEAEKNLVGIFGSNETKHGYGFCDLRSLDKGAQVLYVRCKLPISPNNLDYCPSIASYLASDKNAKQDAEINKKANISDLTSYSDKQELSETRFGFYFQKILCIGDSLTHGDYGSYPEGTPNDRKWNYPYYLSKITNATVLNNGYDGYTPIMMWENKDSNISKDNDFDLILIYLGTNGGLSDNVDSVAPGYDYNNYNTNTNTGAYCALIAWLKEQKPQSKIMLINFHYGRRGNEWSKTMSAVIAKIAEKFNLYVIDVMNNSPFEATVENARIYRPVGIDEEIQATGSSMGNLHFGRLGYLTFARCVYQETQRIISENKEDFALGY